MEDIKKITQQVKIILLKYPYLRSSFQRKQLHIKYWQEFDGVGKFGISINEYPKLTSGETISRACRKIQQENLELRADIKSQQISADLAEKHRINYLKFNRKNLTPNS